MSPKHGSVDCNTTKVSCPIKFSPGRLPELKLNKFSWPRWDGKEIGRHQFCLIYPMVNCCRDHNGDDLEWEYTMDLVAEKVFKCPDDYNRIPRSLTKPKIQITIAVAKMVRPYIWHFAEQAHALHKEYAAAKGFPEPQLHIPP